MMKPCLPKMARAKRVHFFYRRALVEVDGCIFFVSTVNDFIFKIRRIIQV